MKPGTPVLTPERPYSVSVEARESLPFRVRLVAGAQDLAKAVDIRSSAYARHIPSVGEALRDPEADDIRSDVLLLIAERKLDKRALGSMRLQSNISCPLRIESVTALPPPYRGRRLVEFMRLGVENGIAGRMVTAALAKASYEISHAAGFEFIVACGRRSTAEIYRSMLFDDALGGETVHLSYGGGLAHGLFCLPVADADRRWSTSGHGLYDFMARTEHPDIEIDYERVSEAFGQP